MIMRGSFWLVSQISTTNYTLTEITLKMSLGQEQQQQQLTLNVISPSRAVRTLNYKNILKVQLVTFPSEEKTYRNTAVGISAGNLILNFWLNKSFIKPLPNFFYHASFGLICQILECFKENKHLCATPLFNMNDCSVHLDSDAGTSREMRSSLILVRLWHLPSQLSKSGLLLWFVLVRLSHWSDQLFNGNLIVDSAAQHHGLWGTPCLWSWPRWRTVRCPDQPAGFLID